MIDKNVLEQYTDIKKEIEEVRDRIEKTEKYIKRIEEQGPVTDMVTGGEGGIQHYKIEGFPYPDYTRKMTSLYARRAVLTTLEMDLIDATTKVESFIANINDSRIRRIISLRFLKNNSWIKVAISIGGNATADSVRMEFERFMKKN